MLHSTFVHMDVSFSIVAQLDCLFPENHTVNLATIFQGSRENSNQVEESQRTLRLVLGTASIAADQLGLDNISRQFLVPRRARTENTISSNN